MEYLDPAVGFMEFEDVWYALDDRPIDQVKDTLVSPARNARTSSFMAHN
jgi:hypothetical protein